MADLEFLLRELRRGSDDGASTWQLLRLFDENDFDPSLTAQLIRATHDQAVRLEAAQIVRQGPDPTKSATPITNEDIQKIAQLVHDDTTIVSVSDPGGHQISPRAKADDGPSTDERNALEEAAADYIRSRPDIVRAMTFTMRQNELRHRANLPTFGLEVFIWDIREFVANTLGQEKATDAFFVPLLTKNIYDIARSAQFKGK